MSKQTCICKGIPNRFRCEVADKSGKTLFFFHRNCPLHGVAVSDDIKPLKAVRMQAWVTGQQMIDKVAFFRQKERLILAEYAPDGKKVRLEWTEWQIMSEAEQAAWEVEKGYAV